MARPATLQDVQVALVREVPQGLTRAEWLLACEASYPKVYRALIAMGASPEDAADALQDAFEDALGEHGVVAKPEGWMFVVASRAWSAIAGGTGSFGRSPQMTPECLAVQERAKQMAVEAQAATREQELELKQRINDVLAVPCGAK